MPRVAVLLGRSAPPSALKTLGETFGKRIGAKKANAVVRKLAVIPHRMWTTNKAFQGNAEASSPSGSLRASQHLAPLLLDRTRVLM